MKRRIGATLTGLFAACALTSSAEQPPTTYEIRTEQARDNLVTVAIQAANHLVPSQVFVDSESPLLESLMCRNNNDSDGIGIVIESRLADPHASSAVSQLVSRTVNVEGVGRTDKGYRVLPGATPSVCYTKVFARSDGKGGLVSEGTEVWRIEGTGDDLKLGRGLGVVDLEGETRENHTHFLEAIEEFTVAQHGLEQMARGK